MIRDQTKISRQQAWRLYWRLAGAYLVFIILANFFEAQLLAALDALNPMLDWLGTPFLAYRESLDGLTPERAFFFKLVILLNMIAVPVGLYLLRSVFTETLAQYIPLMELAAGQELSAPCQLAGDRAGAIKRRRTILSGVWLIILLLGFLLFLPASDRPTGRYAIYGSNHLDYYLLLEFALGQIVVIMGLDIAAAYRAYFIVRRQQP